VRVARGPGPGWLDDLVAGYRVVHAAEPNGPAATAYRGWLDELPGLPDAEGRATTLRYAATAVFERAEGDCDAKAVFARLVRALEGEGSFLIPLDPADLADEGRYEVLPRPGAHPPRLVRPGFRTRDGLVQQRAKVAADPGLLGAAGP